MQLSVYNHDWLRFWRERAHTNAIETDNNGNLLFLTQKGNAERHTVRSFANIPACSGSVEGSTAAVNDATSSTWGATITAGGGTHHVMLYCDGTN